MKLSELFNEGEVIPFKGKDKPKSLNWSDEFKKHLNSKQNMPPPDPHSVALGSLTGMAFADTNNDGMGDINWDEVLKDDPDCKPNSPTRMSQDEIDDLMYDYRNLSVGSQLLYNNRLAQIIKTPDADRYVIKFDDTGEKKIIGRKDGNIKLIPEDHLN